MARQPLQIRLLHLTVVMFTCMHLPVAAADNNEKPSAIQKARSLLARQKTGDAIALLKEQIQLQPHVALLHNELGAAYLQTGDLRQATSEFLIATKAEPSLAHAWANLGESLRLQRLFKKAARAFHTFLQLSANDRYGLYGLALSFEGYEAYDKALQTLSVAEKEARSDSALRARINQARRRLNEKVKEAGLPALERGDARFVSARYKAALAVYASGLRATPGDATLLSRIGLTYAVLGKVERSITYFEAALRVDPNEAVANFAYPNLKKATATSDGLSLSDLVRQDRPALLLQRAGSTPTPPKAEAYLRMGRLDDAQATAPSTGGAAIRAEVHVLRGELKEAEREASSAVIDGDTEDIPTWRRSLLR